jgi:hypothetical protein
VWNGTLRNSQDDSAFDHRGIAVKSIPTSVRGHGAEHRNRYEWIAPEVTLALSALTTITILEHGGYALMPL